MYYPTTPSKSFEQLAKRKRPSSSIEKKQMKNHMDDIANTPIGIMRPNVLKSAKNGPHQ
jgi:hypothetical protein